MTNLIKNWNDRAIRIRGDRYGSLTDMAQATGKRVNNWLRLDSTKSYLKALESVTHLSATDLVQVIQGGDPQNQGTWGHPKVTIRFAQWCSDDFAVQVDIWTDELMTTGKVELVPQQFAIPKTRAEALRLAADLEEKNQALIEENQRLELQAAKDAPKIDDYNRLINSDGWMCIREIHKCLAIPNFKQKDLQAFLKNSQVKILSKDTNQPYADWVGKGLAKMQPDRTPNGFAYNIPVFSYKGCIKILETLKKHGRIPSDHQCEFDFGFKVDRGQLMIASSKN